MRWYLSGRGGGRMSVSPCKHGTHVCPFGSFWFAISNTFRLSSACSMVETVIFSVQWWCSSVGSSVWCGSVQRLS